MELYQLRTFLSVAKTGSVSRSAEILNTSQPAVSAQIKALEEEAGAPLFFRTSHGMELTGTGQKVRRHAEKIHVEVEKLEHLLSGSGKIQATAMHLAINTESGFLKIDGLVNAVLSLSPEMTLQFIQNSSAEILKKITETRIEGGFVFGKAAQKSVELLPLCNAELVIASPAAWKERVRNAALHELLRLPWILPTESCPFHEHVMELFSKYKVTPQNCASSDFETMTLHLILSGTGISLLPRYMAEGAGKGAIFIEEREKSEIKLSFAYLNRNRNKPAIKMILAALKTVWEL